MPFKIAARTILELGAELISSDSIAFYELIKNSFDAGSPSVDIDIVIPVPYPYYREVLAYACHLGQEDMAHYEAGLTVTDMVLNLTNMIDRTAPNSNQIDQALAAVSNWSELESSLRAFNYVQVRDAGEGMTISDLQNVYLTLGTRARLKQRESGTPSGGRPILGEKGLGRLSAMRLGNRLVVESTVLTEPNWNILDIDWRIFSHESDDMLEDIVLEPAVSSPKVQEESGTIITVSDLTSDWSKDKVDDIARQQFTKLTDPFGSRNRYPIRISYNGTQAPIPQLTRQLFEASHAKVTAEFQATGDLGYALSGHINYSLMHREKTFLISGTDLLSITKAGTLDTLQGLGPFSLVFYWYNRRLLNEVEGIGDAKAVRELLKQWSGGLMVYRDGFRVNPYGGADDDWLDIDRSALASSGYKVSRAQIVGQLLISASRNPKLSDQTNREGIRDSEEKQVLIRLLRYIIIEQFRAFLNAVQDESNVREPVRFDDLEARIEAEEANVHGALNELLTRYPIVREDAGLIDTIETSLSTVRTYIDQLKELADSYDRGRTQLLNLAGSGLMVEIVAHELVRLVGFTLSNLAAIDPTRVSAETARALETLRFQLSTLSKRLRILDPISTAGRQVKQHFNMFEWIEQILETHRAQFERHDIALQYDRVPSNYEWRVRMVKGMIVQIIENLVSNSVYWIKQYKKIDRAFKPQITIVVDSGLRQIRVTDNGPGIDPERREEIFRPFVTTKPPGEGKGLGLFISQEIAEYHGAELFLSSDINAEGKLQTFVLQLEASVR